ncbi:hypothetical protein N9C35_03410 [Flavobacteriaceae bacterium]|nr:hypothetical protein [Flavobacteriaceae bacterium]
MLVPSKYENLEKNLLVLGSSIISLLRRDTYDIESLFQELNGLQRDNGINLDQYYSAISFLWCSEIIELDNYIIFLKEANVLT